MQMTRRQFLQACLGAAASPAIAKLDAAEAAVFGRRSGPGWVAVDKGEFWEVTMEPHAVMDRQSWGKPVIAYMGDRSQIKNTTFYDGGLNIDQDGRIILDSLHFDGARKDLPAALTFDGRDSPLEIEFRGTTTFHAQGDGLFQYEPSWFGLDRRTSD